MTGEPGPCWIGERHSQQTKVFSQVPHCAQSAGVHTHRKRQFTHAAAETRPPTDEQLVHIPILALPTNVQVPIGTVAKNLGMLQCENWLPQPCQEAISG